MLADDPVAAEGELRPVCDDTSARERTHQDASAELAAALYLQGRYAEAEQWTELIAKTSIDLSKREIRWLDIRWRKVRAKLLAQRGEFQTAEQLAREAVTLSERTDWLNLRGDALMIWQRCRALLTDPMTRRRLLKTPSTCTSRRATSSRPARRATWSRAAQDLKRLGAVACGSPAASPLSRTTLITALLPSPPTISRARRRHGRDVRRNIAEGATPHIARRSSNTAPHPRTRGRKSPARVRYRRRVAQLEFIPVPGSAPPCVSSGRLPSRFCLIP